MAIPASPPAIDADEILSTIRDEIDAGHDLAHIDRTLLDRLALDPEYRDALWLYAWAYHARGRAPVGIAQLDAT